MINDKNKNTKMIGEFKFIFYRTKKKRLIKQKMI